MTTRFQAVHLKIRKKTAKRCFTLHCATESGVIPCRKVSAVLFRRIGDIVENRLLFELFFYLWNSILCPVCALQENHYEENGSYFMHLLFAPVHTAVLRVCRGEGFRMEGI